jgi:hypothetical protein
MTTEQRFEKQVLLKEAQERVVSWTKIITEFAENKREAEKMLESANESLRIWVPSYDRYVKEVSDLQVELETV